MIADEAHGVDRLVRRPSRDDYATPLIVEGRGEEVFECSDDTFGLFHATFADQVAGKLA